MQRPRVIDGRPGADKNGNLHRPQSAPKRISIVSCEWLGSNEYHGFSMADSVITTDSLTSVPMVPLFPFSPNSGIGDRAINIKWQTDMAEYFGAPVRNVD